MLAEDVSQQGMDVVNILNYSQTCFMSQGLLEHSDIKRS